MHQINCFARTITSPHPTTFKANYTMRNGKISIVKSLKKCKHCEPLGLQILQLRREIGKVKNQLMTEREKSEEMSILCEQIEKTKKRLIEKLEARQESLKVAVVQQDTSRTVKVKSSLRRRYSAYNS